MSVQELIRDSGVELSDDQVIWTLRYLAAATDTDTHSRQKHKARLYKEWRGAGRKFMFRWADDLVAAMSEAERCEFRDYVFDLLAEALPPGGAA